MATLKMLKSIPYLPKMTVFGYTREREKELILPRIPVMLNNIILIFYFHGEYWEKFGYDLGISEDKTSIQRMTPPIGTTFCNNTAYGKLWIPSTSNQIITWIFKIESFGFQYNYINEIIDGKFYIGIVSKDNRLNEDFANKEDKPYQYFEIRPNSTFLKDGEFMMTMKLKEQTLEIGDDILSIKTGHEIRYKLALCVTGNGGQIRLINVHHDQKLNINQI